MPRIYVDDLDDPRVQVYRQLKGQSVLRRGDYFIVEGTKTVARLLDSDYETASVLLTDKREAEWGPRIPEGLPCYILPHDLGSKLVGFNFHVGVVACGRRKRSPTLEEALPRDADRLSLVICPKCDNPENLGAIIRISAGFGVDAILLGQECCDPFSRRVLRVSMGTALRMTLIDSRDLARDLDRLRSEWRVELMATVLDSTAEDLQNLRRPERLGLMFGNEDSGLEDRWLALSDRRITIPMHPGADSLNVAVAAGIFLYHFLR